MDGQARRSGRWRTLAIAVAVLLSGHVVEAQDMAKEPRPSREALARNVQPQLDETPRPYVPADVTEPPPDAPTRFDAKYGRLKVILLDDKVHPSLRDGRSLWALTEALVYWPSNGHEPIIVPRGFVTDLASIPRPLWFWLPPDGPWAKAAVIHDFLYYTQGTGVWSCHDTTLRRRYTKEDADWILRDAQKDRNVGPVSRNLVWFGVHVGGQRGWDNSPGLKDIGRCNPQPQLPPDPPAPVAAP